MSTRRGLRHRRVAYDDPSDHLRPFDPQNLSQIIHNVGLKLDSTAAP